MEKVLSLSWAASLVLSLSWCFEGVKSWHVGKKYQFLGGGWVLRDEASWECRNVLLHTVCISLSLDWKVAPCPGFSSSLNMWILWSCNPKCGYSGLFHACSPGCWRICGGGATLFWNRWCTPRTSPPPPARPPWSRPPPPGRWRWWLSTCPGEGSRPPPPSSSLNIYRSWSQAHSPQGWVAWCWYI